MLREMPQSFEAEQALLGAVLANNAAYQTVSEVLRPEHFADPLHGKIWDWTSRLVERGQVVNAFVLKTYAEQDQDLAKVGGPAYFAKLLGQSVHALDVGQFARMVRDAAMRRRLIGLANDALAAAYQPSPDDTASTVIERLERGLYDLAEKAETSEGFTPFRRGLTEAIVQAEAANRRDGGLAGLSTGLKRVDSLLGGLHRSDLLILAARPSMGKTALATNMAVHAAMAGSKVGFYSLEMSAEQLATRIAADRAGVPSDRIRKGHLTSVEFDRFLTASHQLEQLSLFVDDTAALTIAQLRARARRLKRQHGLDLLVVDYLQLVDAADRRKDGRVQEVSEITRGLKTLAKELDVPVLALSQLNRAVEQRQDKRPQLADLRDSGSIEQDADVVMFLYREEYYLERDAGADPGKLEAARGRAELLVAKHRHGPTDMVPLMFDGPTTRFSDAP